MRRILVAGNWKMNLTHIEATTLANELAEKIGDVLYCDVAIFPPFVFIDAVWSALDAVKTRITVGGQNMHHEASGAFTGEISADMLKSVGAEMVLLGHSERRHIFGEDDEFINLKVQRALDAGITPILCVGETLEERQSGKTNEIILEQLRSSLDEISLENPNDLIIAYEPVWAIGTGVNATPDQAQEVHAYIRSVMPIILGDFDNYEFAKKMRLLYGGSVKPENAKMLLNKPDIDGLLVGGASLSADGFAAIVRAAKDVKKN